jgi:hypothetical protein
MAQIRPLAVPATPKRTSALAARFARFPCRPADPRPRRLYRRPTGSQSRALLETGTGSPHRSCDLGTPLLRPHRPAVTRRACWPAKALSALERGTRRADPPLAGRRVHARRDPAGCSAPGAGDAEPGAAWPARKTAQLDPRTPTRHAGSFLGGGAPVRADPSLRARRHRLTALHDRRGRVRGLAAAARREARAALAVQPTCWASGSCQPPRALDSLVSGR